MNYSTSVHTSSTTQWGRVMWSRLWSLEFCEVGVISGPYWPSWRWKFVISLSSLQPTSCIANQAFSSGSQAFHVVQWIHWIDSQRFEDLEDLSVKTTSPYAVDSRWSCHHDGCRWPGAEYVPSAATLLTQSLKQICCHFNEIFVTGSTASCHFDNFQCSQWR